MNQFDPILAADEAEERCARDALRCTATKDELIAAWDLDCEHFRGEARERLQHEFTLRAREFGMMGLVG